MTYTMQIAYACVVYEGPNVPSNVQLRLHQELQESGNRCNSRLQTLLTAMACKVYVGNWPAHVWGLGWPEKDSNWDHTIMTDTHWLVQNPGTAAMTVTVPGTQ